MCHAVANGIALWQYPAAQGDALYLALEDTQKRLKERLSKVSPTCDLDIPTDIHFATQAPKLGSGLAEQIITFLDEHPQTKLIVIDTLQYIRKSTGTYSGDYRDMDKLRAIIAGRKLTLLLITHTRKTGDADPLNLISGSTGLAGAVDGVFVLEKSKRIGNTARLTIANRDTEDHQFELHFDSTSCRWQFLGEIIDEENDDDEEFYDLLGCLVDKYPAWSGTATELSAALNAINTDFVISPITLSRILKSRQEYLKSQYGIDCIFERNKSKRIIQLSRDIIDTDCKEAEQASAESVALQIRP